MTIEKLHQRELSRDYGVWLSFFTSDPREICKILHQWEDRILLARLDKWSQRVVAPKVEQLNIRRAEDGADVRRNVQQNVMCCDMYSRWRQLTYFRFVDWPSEVLIGDLIIIAELACSLITLTGKLSCPGDEGVWLEQVCSSTHSSSTLCGGEWSTSRPDLHPREEYSKLGASQRRSGRFAGQKILLLLPAFVRPSPALPQLFHVRLPDRPIDCQLHWSTKFNFFFFGTRGKISNPNRTFNAEFKCVSSVSPSPTVCLWEPS